MDGWQGELRWCNCNGSVRDPSSVEAVVLDNLMVRADTSRFATTLLP